MTGRDATEFNNGRFDVFRGTIDMAFSRGTRVSVITRKVAGSDRNLTDDAHG